MLTYPFVHLSACPVPLSILLFFHPSVYSCTHIFIHQSTHPLICPLLSIYPSIHLPIIHLLIYPFIDPFISLFGPTYSSIRQPVSSLNHPLTHPFAHSLSSSCAYSSFGSLALYTCIFYTFYIIYTCPFNSLACLSVHAFFPVSYVESYLECCFFHAEDESSWENKD